MSTEISWSERRQEVALKAGVTNLNVGTCSPVVKPVLAELLRLTAMQSEDPEEFIFRYAPTALEEHRRVLADYIGAPAKDTLLIVNSSYGINTVLASLKLAAGDEILLSDQEYHHYLPLLDKVASATGARLKAVPLPLADTDATPESIVRRFELAMTPRTRLVFFSHVTSACGMVLPARELCQLARRHGAMSLVDGAHAVGLVPLSIADLKPDFYTANIHKWLMGAAGSAFLYVAPERRDAIAPLVTSARYKFDWGLADEATWPGGPTHWIASHEYQGTRSYAPLLTIGTAVQYQKVLGLAAIHERTLPLRERCREIFAALGWREASPSHPELKTCMMSYHWPEAGAAPNMTRAGYRLRHDHQFEIGLPSLNDGRPLVRFSCAWFVNEAELVAFARLAGRMDWHALGA